MADKSFGVKELNLLNASGTPTITSPNNLNLNANTVAISTSVTIGHNLTVSANAGISSLNVSGIATVVNFNATGISTIAQPANANPHSLWDVVNNSASAYRFTGPGQDGAEDNPDIYLVRGQRYVFKMNASGHPFQIRVSNGGSAYSDGVTNNGAQTGNVVFNVQHDAPAHLFYQCTSHGSMVGNIYIVGQHLANGANNRVLTATSAYGMNGESNLTYDGNALSQTIDANDEGINITSSGAHAARFKVDTNQSGADDTIFFQSARWNGTEVASIHMRAGSDTTNKDDGRITFHTTPSGGSNTERVRITSDGQVLIGATSYAGGGNNPALYIRTASANAVKIHKTGSGQSSLQLTCDSGTDPDEGNSTGLHLTQEGTSSYIMNQDNGDMFVLMNGTSTIHHRSNGTIRARSAVSGANTATYNENVAWNSFSCNSSNGYDFKIINQNSSPAYSYSLELAAAANVNNTNYRHINCTKNSSSAGIFVVYGNGNVANANNSYGSTSDVKLKENIVDANSQWDDVKQLRVRNFNFIADSNKTKLLGLVAQEAETVCPSLVQNIKDLEEDENGNKTETGTVTKELKYSVLYMKAIKCLQEAQARIETLEAKVAALEGS